MQIKWPDSIHPPRFWCYCPPILKSIHHSKRCLSATACSSKTNSSTSSDPHPAAPQPPPHFLPQEGGGGSDLIAILTSEFSSLSFMYLLVINHAGIRFSAHFYKVSGLTENILFFCLQRMFGRRKGRKGSKAL